MGRWRDPSRPRLVGYSSATGGRRRPTYPAGWLYDRLAHRFGSGQVFKDVDSIQLGDDFVEVITGAVGSCDVLLALIGDEWLTITDEHGRRRLDDRDDFVRLEIEAALARKVRVIPILVDGARMPREEELPESLAELSRRPALELSPARFDFDTGRLLKVLDWTLAEARAAQGEAPPPEAPEREAPDPGTAEPPKRWGRSTRARILAGIGAVVILLIVAVAVRSQMTSRSAEGGGESGVSGLVVVPQTDCTRRYFAQRPAVGSSRVRSVELDAVDRRVLGAGEPQDTEFGLVFSDTLSAAAPRVLGAMKLFRRPGVGFHVISMVDEQNCQPVGVSLASDPGVPPPPPLATTSG